MRAATKAKKASQQGGLDISKGDTPVQLTLSAEAAAVVAKQILQPKKPTKAMKALMRSR